jgi:hypothetical protein
MAHKEKGRPAGGDPIPKIVREDDLEFKPQPFDLQVMRLTRRYALTAAVAAIVAPLAFPEASR